MRHPNFMVHHHFLNEIFVWGPIFGHNLTQPNIILLVLYPILLPLLGLPLLFNHSDLLSFISFPRSSSSQATRRSKGLADCAFFFQVGVVKPKTAEIYGCSAPQNMGLSINDGAIWYPNSWMAKVENATGMMTGDTPQETSRLVAGSSWSPLAATDSSSEWSPNLKGGFRDHNLAQKPIEFMMTSINTAPNTNTKHPGLSGESVHLGVLQSSSSPC